jgi:hypothetical protein
LITPPNFGSGGGSCLPLIVVVALGEPSTPVTCCADARPMRPREAIRGYCQSEGTAFSLLAPMVEFRETEGFAPSILQVLTIDAL